MLSASVAVLLSTLYTTCGIHALAVFDRENKIWYRSNGITEYFSGFETLKFSLLTSPCLLIDEYLKPSVPLVFPSDRHQSWMVNVKLNGIGVMQSIAHSTSPCSWFSALFTFFFSNWKGLFWHVYKIFRMLLMCLATLCWTTNLIFQTNKLKFQRLSVTSMETWSGCAVFTFIAACSAQLHLIIVKQGYNIKRQVFGNWIFFFYKHYKEIGQHSVCLLKF